MELIKSYRVSIHKAKTGHGSDTGRIEVNDIDLCELIGEKVMLQVIRI